LSSQPTSDELLEQNMFLTLSELIVVFGWISCGSWKLSEEKQKNNKNSKSWNTDKKSIWSGC